MAFVAKDAVEPDQRLDRTRNSVKQPAGGRPRNARSAAGRSPVNLDARARAPIPISALARSHVALRRIHAPAS
jgi:hypothetical protein